MSKEVGAGGRFDVFLDSAPLVPTETNWHRVLQTSKASQEVVDSLGISLRYFRSIP